MALTRNPDAIGGNQWPSLAIPMQSVAPLTHRCSTKGIEPQLSMPPTPACDRAVSSTCRSGGYDLGTVIRGNQAPYSSTVLRGNQWQSSAVLKHCAQGQSGAIKRRTQALCSGAIRGNQAPYSSTVLGGNQWQSVAIKAPSHLRAIDAHTREISLDEIGRVARARPTAVWQAIEIVRDEMMAAHRERPVAREQQRAREAGFVTERHPTALELVTGLLRAHVPAQGAIRRNQAQSGAIRRNQAQSGAISAQSCAISAHSDAIRRAIERQRERGGPISRGRSGGRGDRGVAWERGEGGDGGRRGREGGGGGRGRGGEGGGATSYRKVCSATVPCHTPSLAPAHRSG